MSPELRKKYVQNSTLWSWIFPRSPSPVRGFWKSPRAARRALGPPLRPPFGASRLSPASAPALGHGVLPSGIFKIPSGLRGSGWKSPPKNQNFLYKFQEISREISRGCLSILKFQIRITYGKNVEELFWWNLKLCETSWNLFLYFFSQIVKFPFATPRHPAPPRSPYPRGSW